jgi:transposase
VCGLPSETLQRSFLGHGLCLCHKSRKALRLLIYDGQGFWLCHKRLSKGRFVWNFSGKMHSLAARQLQLLLWNNDPTKIVSEDFRPITPTILQT